MIVEIRPFEFISLQCWKRTRLFPGASSSNMDSWSPDYAGQVAAVTLPPTPLLAIFLFITKAKDTHRDFLLTENRSHTASIGAYKVFQDFQVLGPWNSMELVHLGTSWHLGTCWYRQRRSAGILHQARSPWLAGTRPLRDANFINFLRIWICLKMFNCETLGYSMILAL